MYGIDGIDDEAALRQLLGTTPLDNLPEGFQTQPPEITPGLFGDTSGLAQDIQALADSGGSDIAALMAQAYGGNTGGGGQNRLANLRGAAQNTEAQRKGNQQQGLGTALAIAKFFI